jgi:hypothetical protein
LFLVHFGSRDCSTSSGNSANDRSGPKSREKADGVGSDTRHFSQGKSEVRPKGEAKAEAFFAKTVPARPATCGSRLRLALSAPRHPRRRSRDGKGCGRVKSGDAGIYAHRGEDAPSRFTVRDGSRSSTHCTVCHRLCRTHGEGKPQFMGTLDAEQERDNLSPLRIRFRDSLPSRCSRIVGQVPQQPLTKNRC